MNNPIDDDTKPDMPAIADTDLNDQVIRRQVIEEKLLDAETPGAIIEFEPDEAELIGAFEEDALSEADALDSTIDKK